MSDFSGYFISVKCLDLSMLSYHFFYLAEKDELCLSFNRRLCGIFSKNMARFETDDLAGEFLKTVKLKSGFSYQIDKYSSSDPADKSVN